MQFHLTKRPKGAKLITGFPSMGLVSTIATKFLIEHLDVEIIGQLEGKEFLPLKIKKESNWTEEEIGTEDKEQYYRQF